MLVAEHRVPELERLMPMYDPNVEVSHEVYTAKGYLMYVSNNPSRAAYLSHKVPQFSYIPWTKGAATYGQGWGKIIKKTIVS